MLSYPAGEWAGGGPGAARPRVGGRGVRRRCAEGLAGILAPPPLAPRRHLCPFHFLIREVRAPGACSVSRGRRRVSEWEAPRDLTRLVLLGLEKLVSVAPVPSVLLLPHRESENLL